MVFIPPVRRLEGAIDSLSDEDCEKFVERIIQINENYGGRTLGRAVRTALWILLSKNAEWEV